MIVFSKILFGLVVDIGGYVFLVIKVGNRGDLLVEVVDTKGYNFRFSKFVFDEFDVSLHLLVHSIENRL